MNDKTLHLKFLSLRLLNSPNSQKENSMQRNLQTNEHYYFYSGIEISDELITIKKNVSDSLFNGIGINKHPNTTVDICAIVGENGSGKSTIVDYVIRIINNLSTCIFGEEYRSPESGHLHYIEGVFAELYILIRDYIIKIECNDTILKTSKYLLLGFEDETFEFEDGTIRFERVEAPININYSIDTEHILKEQPERHQLLQDFCYTIITNFSLYSFAPFNYMEEITPFRKEEEIRKRGIELGYKIKSLKEISTTAEGNDRRNIEERCWIKGLFHKNDGFQVPIVITPMRNVGCIDIQRENKLAKERLLSLLFLRKEGRNSRYFFNRINGKLIIDGFTIKKDYEENTNKYLGRTLQYLSNKELYRVIYDDIVLAIINQFQIKYKKEHHIDIVWSYIVYKVIKIIFKYPRYQRMRYLIKDIPSIDIFRQEMNDTVFDILHDHSHITRKLFRSIYYLKYQHIGRRKSFRVDEFGESIENIIQNEKGICKPQYIEELLPPPVFSIDFKLYDHNDKEKKYPISFHTLSSGEKQITYTLASFYYYLSNIDSVDNFARRASRRSSKMQYVNYEPQSKMPLIQYEHVNVIFDEIELYFHPEMQRTFIHYLLDGLSQMQFRKLRNIQIMLVTHSPFILSDIPKENVLFLSKNGEPQDIKDMCTFGANIHTMLKHSFFLQDGSMGKYAQNTINDIITKVNRYTFIHQFKEIKETSNDNDREWKLNYFKQCNSFILAKSFTKEEILHIENGEFEKLLENESKDYKDIQSIISLIQEPIIETNLLKQLRKWGNYVDIE